LNDVKRTKLEKPPGGNSGIFDFALCNFLLEIVDDFDLGSVEGFLLARKVTQVTESEGLTSIYLLELDLM
jgi:hypothetical protein